MKKLTTTILTCGILASALVSAGAAPTMRLSADGGLTWTNVVDNGPLDFDLTPGVITYAGPVGNWTVVISQGDGIPAIGTAITPNMDLSTTDISAGPATLIVQMSDINFVGFPNETYLASVTTTAAGTFTYNVYRDSGNVLFGSTANYGDPGVSPSPTAVQLFSEGPFGSGISLGSNGVAVADGGSGPYSLTLESVITHTSAGRTLSDTLLTAVPPPPCSCSLTYDAPQSLSICAGDPIPDVSVSQTCDGGVSRTPVIASLISSITNGICPLVVTRNYTATTTCNDVVPFTQTITINCKPDCTILPSVTTALAGGTGYTASVADAGPGATYLWTVNNATITLGQGTTQITWTAGTDPTMQATICVRVTTAAGCVSQCCAYVPVTPRCSCVLTFNSPSTLTVCAGDTIPPVTASENCGSGQPTSVTVKCIGASTNGTCPKIITRTNTATDDCGTVYKFVQTITVNCRGSICGHIFADCDGDGDLSEGDVGISKITVTLLDSNNHVIGTTSSDANGGYCFTNLPGGNYVVTINPPVNYCQTAASTSYHWKDSYGRTCWQENDGYIHCLSSGTECWWDKSNTCHWKDSYSRDCWKDSSGNSHCQPLSYKSCNAPTNNNTICVTLTNCASLSDVDFAYAGTKPSISISCSGPSYVKCGQSYTYTCCVTNTGNVCFKGGTVCTSIGNCNNWGGWNNCNTFNGNCPPLGPGQKCTFTVKCSFNSWNCGTVTCQSQANCSPNYGNGCSGQSTCYSQCGW